MLAFLKSIIPLSVLRFFQPIYHWMLAALAAFWYGYPSRGMTVIGVTGTNGKSTVVELVSRILEETGFRVASVSSIRFKIAKKEWPNDLKMTMPGRFFLQKFLRDAKKQHSTHAVLEVTSEGIKQFRHRGVDWDALIFTNLTPEHIEAHGSFEKYQKAKEKVFKLLSKTYRKKDIPKIIVVNGDDKYSKDFLKYDADKKISYSLKDVNYSIFQDGMNIVIEGVVIKTKLLGEFNLYNILGAITLARALNIGWDEIKRAIEKIKFIPGRLEFIQSEPFSVIVDYAHTPDALRKVYETLKNSYKLQATSYKLICVLGSAGGGRDKWKRKEFGKIAGEFCNQIIVTNEAPYDEDPEKIIQEVASGAEERIRGSLEKAATINVSKILDRAEAIKRAIQNARNGDVVIITGKGAESWIMGPAGQNIPWDDRKIAREALQTTN